MAAKKKKTSAPAEASVSLTASTLLLSVGMLLVLGVRVNAGDVLHLSDVLPFFAWLISAAVLVGLLRMGGYSGSPALVELILMLSAIGVLVRSRMEGSIGEIKGWSHVLQPLGFLWIWLAWVFSRRGRVSSLKIFWPLAFLLSLLVVGGLIALGSRFRGAFYGPGGLTPSEILKVLIPLALAGYFSRTDKQWDHRPFWNPPLGQGFLLGSAWLMLCGVLLLQRDLGLMVLLSFSLVVVLVTATRSWSWGVLCLAGLAGGVWLVLEYVDHGARRLQAWLDPFADPTGSGWQVLQGLTGLYAGGLTGTGLGSGRPDRLPIAGSDFVYAVYAEELGYIGCVLLLILFAMLLRRAAAVVNLQTEPFAGLFATGLVAILGVQILVNISGVVTLLPVTGITLPFISQGGSSLWVTSIQFGLLLGMAEPLVKKAKSKKSGGKRK